MEKQTANCELKDWDLDPPMERNLNFPPPKNHNFLPSFKNVPSTSGYSVSLPFPDINKTPTKLTNGYQSRDSKYNFPPTVENGILPSESSGFQPAVKNGDKLISGKKDDMFTGKKPKSTLISKAKPPLKRKKNVPNKDSKSTKEKRLVTPPMKKFISSSNDQNILKSVRTYGKKLESISPTTTVVDNVINSSKSSKHEKENSETVRTNGVTKCLFVDDGLFSDINSDFPEISNETPVLESVNSDVKSNVTSQCDSGYQRTRKNLKNRVVRKRKPNNDSEQLSPVQSCKKVKTVQIAANTTPPPLALKANNPRKRSQKCRMNKKDPLVCLETSTPIDLQANNSSKEIDQDVFNSSLKGAKKLGHTNNILSVPRKQLTVLDIVQKLSVKESQQTEKTPKLLAENSATRSTVRKISPLDIVKRLSVGQCNKADETSHLQSKKSSIMSNRSRNPSNCKWNAKSQAFTLVEIPYSQSKDCSLTSEGSSCESDVLLYSTHKSASNNCSLKHWGKKGKHNKASGVKKRFSVSKNVSLNSIEKRPEDNIHLVHSLTLENKNFLGIVKETDKSVQGNSGEIQKLTESCSASLKKMQKSVLSLIGTSAKRRAITDNGVLDIAQNPRLSKSVSSESDFNFSDIEITKTKHLGKQSESAVELSSLNSNLKRKQQNLNVSSNSILVNFTKPGPSTNPHHVCSKSKLLYLPLVVCDCSNPNTTSNEHTEFSSLVNNINSFSLYITKQAKNNPQKLKSMISDSGLTDFCERIKSLISRTDTENNCDSSDHPPKTNQSTNGDELCNSSFDSSFNSQTQTSNTIPGADSNLNHDLQSELETQNQTETYVQIAFQQINFINNQCINVMMESFTRNYDDNVHVTVNQFCVNPKTVKVMSEFLSQVDEFTVPSVTKNFQFQFPQNFQDISLISVIRDYIKFFLHKIYPPKLKEISCDSVLKFAHENMSVSEIFAVTCFFKGVELLKPTDFLSRFTCVALLAIYKECERQKQCVST